MLVPTDVLPSALGLTWDLSRKQCLACLNSAVVQSGSLYIVVRLTIRDETDDLVLRFNSASEDAGLERLRVYLYRSRDFGEPHEGDEEERSTLDAAYQDHYDRLVKEYTALLGLPTYTGTWEWDEEDYPDSEAAGQLTYWTTPEGRLQLLYTQQDPELPYEITLECYRPASSA